VYGRMKEGMKMRCERGEEEREREREREIGYTIHVLTEWNLLNNKFRMELATGSMRRGSPGKMDALGKANTFYFRLSISEIAL